MCNQKEKNRCVEAVTIVAAMVTGLDRLGLNGFVCIPVSYSFSIFHLVFLPSLS